MRLLASLTTLPTLAAALPSLWDPSEQYPMPSAEIQVPVTLYVASQGPNSLVVENLFNQVVQRIGYKIDLQLVYTGDIEPLEPEFGVICPHGRSECAGNVQQLCAERYLETKQWWSFIHCQNFEGVKRIGSPEVAFKCAKAAGFDWETSGVGHCAGLDGNGLGVEGVRLLQGSVLLSKAAGIENPCSVHISAEEVCRREEGQWKFCDIGHTVNEFVRAINEEYDRLNE